MSDPANPSDTFPAIVGTTKLDVQYDGMSRGTRVTDNNEPADASDDSVVTYAYDSLSRLIEVTQRIGSLPSRAISSSWRSESLLSGLTYPNGRILDFTFDPEDRLNSVTDRGAALPIADYDYIGVARVAQRSYPGNGTRVSYLNDAGNADVGFDGLRRTVQVRHLRADNSLVVGFEHTYDRINNKLIEEKLRARPWTFPRKTFWWRSRWKTRESQFWMPQIPSCTSSRRWWTRPVRQ